MKNRTPLPQPVSDTTGVTPQLRGMGGEKASDMAEETELMGRRRRELDEGLGFGAGADSQAQPEDRWDGHGQLLGPAPEVRCQQLHFAKAP